MIFLVANICAMFVGPEVESENFDRENMMLPGYQSQMLQDVINNGMK